MSLLSCFNKGVTHIPSQRSECQWGGMTAILLVVLPCAIRRGFCDSKALNVGDIVHSTIRRLLHIGRHP